MDKYMKIGSIYERSDEKGHPFINGLFASPEVEYLKDLKWIWTEKVDGTNIGVLWDGYKITFQGRTEDATIQPKLLDALNNIFLNDAMEQKFEQVFGEKKVILFGEGYGGYIQKHGRKYSEVESFIMFDVYFPESNLYLKRDAVEDVAKKLALDVVPVIGEGTIDEAIEFAKVERKSTIGLCEASMEGVVCRPAIDLRTRTGNMIIVKLKYKDLKNL